MFGLVTTKEYNELIHANNKAYGMIQELCPHEKIEPVYCDCYKCELCGAIMCSKPKGSKVKTEVYK